jgi:hypothetical protein
MNKRNPTLEEVLTWGMSDGLVCSSIGWLSYRLVTGRGSGLSLGLLVVLVVWWLWSLRVRLAERPDDPLSQRLHGSMAQWQHLQRLRHQRMLQRQQFPHVPDGALSRARLPGKPEPNQASLSRAEEPEEDTHRLAAGVGEATGEENAVVVEGTR